MLKMNRIYKVMVTLLIGFTTFYGPILGEVVFSEVEDMTSFVVFYDHISNENIDHIASYDIAIIEPKGTNITNNIYMKNHNTDLYGYMSVVEVEGNDEEKISKMTEAEYLIVDGKRVYIEKYDDYLGDIRSATYRNILLDIIDIRIVQAGFDGVFLDTVGFTEYFDDEVLNTALQNGYIDFLIALKLRFPDLKVFQNRGFKAYKLGSANYIDYLLYEDFKYDTIVNSDYYQELIDDIKRLARENDVSVCVLAQVDEEENRDKAHELGWLYYYNSYESNYLILDESLHHSLNTTKDNVATYLGTTIENESDREAKIMADKSVILANLSKQSLDAETLATIRMFLLSPKRVEVQQLEAAIVRDSNDVPVMVYDKYLMDMNNKEYRAYLMDLFEEEMNKGYDNFLLVYVTSVDKLSGINTTNSEKQWSGYLSLISELKRKHTQISVIQERAVNYFSEELVQIVDGVFWNNFEFTTYENSLWLQNKVDIMYDYQEKYGWKVYLQG